MVNMDSGLSRIARPGMTKRGTNGDQKENQGQIEGGGKKVREKRGEPKIGKKTANEGGGKKIREKGGETQMGKKTATEGRGGQWRAAAVDQSVGPSRPGARRRQD